MATIKDVAREAGVSIATVSCALSGSKPVKSETRSRVLKAAGKLKYIPNSSARNLKKAAGSVVSVIIPDMKSRMYSEAFDSLSSCLQAQGYTTSISFTNGSPDIECARIDEAVSQNTAGILLITSQPENTAFFQDHLISYKIPVVFMEREPVSLPINYIGFKNYDAFYRLTDNLLRKGYRRIAIMCGPLHFSTERQCVQGVYDAMAECSEDLKPTRICVTNLTREDAFSSYLRSFTNDVPEVLISTNREATNGLLVALHYAGLKIPRDLIVVSYSEEAWADISESSGLLTISRSASSLGEEAARMLLRNIQEPDLFEQTITELPVSDELALTQIPKRKHGRRPEASSGRAGHAKEVLQFLAVGNPTVKALSLLTAHFTRMTGIGVNYTFVAQNELFRMVSKDMDELTARYDLYTYDVPWLEYMVQNASLADISDFAESDRFPRDLLIPESLRNCQVNSRYYGIPLSGGTILLFYRRDLFESHQLREEYQRHSSISLRPPRTWKEFNDIAAFFTRSITPSSPTEYGTSFAGIIDEEMAPEILIRLWSYGGQLWDSYRRPSFDTKENRQAFESILATLSCTPDGDLGSSIHKTVRDFCSGRTAMLITYSEFAQEISRYLSGHMPEKVGVQTIPGRHPASVGWNIGLNPFSKNVEAVHKFFSWILQVDTGYYLTILNGATPMKAPYHNYQLHKLYPWLACTEESLRLAVRRNTPYQRRSLILPPNEVEHILCQAFRRVVRENMSVESALEEAQQEANHLFRMYGYPTARKLEL